MSDKELAQQMMDPGKSFTLLSLPINIRIKIYSYCGLIRSCPIGLNIESVRQRWAAHDLATRHIGCSRVHHCQYSEMRLSTINGREFDSDLPSGLECFCPSLPHQLLGVSHAMHMEAETVLYGMNQFKVSRHLPGDTLKVLRALSLRVWSLMSSLHVSLSEVPQFIWSPRTRVYEMVDTGNVAGHQILQKWIAVCRDVLSHTYPNQLKLSLSCNVTDTTTARGIVAPLDSLSPLSELSICLAVDPKQREIQEVARMTITRLKQKETRRETKTAALRSSPLSWASLPRELRLEILTHTDLVDYFSRAQLQYSHYFNTRRDGFEINAGKLLPRGDYCCYNCTPTLATCTCIPIHAAYSTSCTCAIVPRAVFFVSKDMSADATVVFSSRNRFILSGDFAANALFVQHTLGRNITATNCIRTLDLEICLPQLYEMRIPNSGTANDWATLITCVASFLHLPKLWLSIDAGGLRDDLKFQDEDRSWMRTAYAALFVPLYANLVGERRPEKLHVLLCWWSEEEREVEKAIMGGEYESVAEGKLEYRLRHPRYPHNTEMSKIHTRYGENRP